MKVSKVKVKVGAGRSSERMVFMRRTSKIVRWYTKMNREMVSPRLMIKQQVFYR
jgi:hypothetical protein